MTEERHQPAVERVYEGDGIVVRWEPAFCIHTGMCFRGLPEVFDPMARPWVKVDAARAEEVARAIDGCPTGALSYERTDGAADGLAGAGTTVQPRPNGPLFLRGEVEIVDLAGNVQRSATRVALCRCGHSQNKPYCDLSHRAAGFQG
jgi:uncharacterized Fe-S cluster protein YjdI